MALLHTTKMVPLGCTIGAGLLQEGKVGDGTGSHGPFRDLDTCTM